MEGGKKTRFVMGYAAIEKLKLGKDYSVHIMEDNEPTSEEDGTAVTLKNLKIKNAITLENLFASMERRFSILSDRLRVKINGELLSKDHVPFQICHVRLWIKNHTRLPC